MFHFNHICTLQDMDQREIHYEKYKWLRGKNSVNIQCRIIVLVHCPPSHCHLSINTKFHLNANTSFKVICRTRYWMADRRTTWRFGEHKKILLSPAPAHWFFMQVFNITILFYVQLRLLQVLL